VKIKAQIEALENLSSLDAEIAALEEELGVEREALGKKKTELDGLEAKMAASQASMTEMERVRNELVQEARQMSVQMERSREKLGRCRTEREVNAAQREIEELRKLYRDREQEVEKIQALVAQGRAEIEETSARRNDVAGQLGQNEGAVASKLRELETAAAGKYGQRDALVKGVQPTLYRRYEMIRKKRGSAIAHITEGICSGCHMRISPMAFQQLMRGDEFQQCPSCNRIIYFREASGEDSAETGSTGA
jgi:predicted  nucleic acid-binding Zn-ribbon protein